MRNAEFIERAFSRGGPKIFNGFSRPFFHNMMGVLYGHRFNKRRYGGMLRHTEAAMLYYWASQLPRGATIVEIGCYGGLSTCYLAQACRKTGARVVSIDPFDSDLSKQAQLSDRAVPLENKPSRDLVAARLNQHGLLPYVELIEGYSQEVVHHWSGTIDFLWIDGNHDQAFEDYRDWSPFLSAGARVAVHDAHPKYGYPQVAEAARQIFANDGEWTQLEHVKSILTGVRRTSVTTHTRAA